MTELLQLFQVFEPYSVVFLSYVIIYGGVFGVRNTYLRIVSILKQRKLKQSDFGKLLDGIWYFCFLVLYVIG